jgi:kynurenine formamidase
MNATRRLIDVSHTIEHGQVTYKGLPAPVISPHVTREASRASYAPGTEFLIAKIEMIANTGTYLDSSFHRYAEGKDLADLPLAAVADLDCVVARVLARHERAIDRLPLAESDVRGRAVLVGIDSLNIDGTDGRERPVHSTLLAHDVPVVEHLCNLAGVPERGGRFFAVPAKVKAFPTFPVHAFVLV